MNKTNVEQNVIEEVLKDCSFYERIVFKIFKKEFVKIYNMIRIKLMNVCLWSERMDYPKITRNWNYMSGNA